jgi:hypothetical protein
MTRLSDDSSVHRFRKHKPAPPRESDIVLDCGGHLLKKWARNAARARIAERERLARVRGVKIRRPELRVVEGPEDDALR